MNLDLRIRVSFGNLKIGKDTMILNMGSATDCPAMKLGLCPLPNPKDCYAMQPERSWPNVLPYRRKQEEYWKETDERQISKDILALNMLLEKPPKFFRFSEAHDFAEQYDVNKMRKITERINKSNSPMKIYGYTARSDLDLKGFPKNTVINGSGFMLDNNFTIVNEFSKDAKFRCMGDCRVCNLCKTNSHKLIEVRKH